MPSPTAPRAPGDAALRGEDAAKAADEYVHEHPWGAVGIAAAAGLLVGVLIARR